MASNNIITRYSSRTYFSGKRDIEKLMRPMKTDPHQNDPYQIYSKKVVGFPKFRMNPLGNSMKGNKSLTRWRNKAGL